MSIRCSPLRMKFMNTSSKRSAAGHETQVKTVMDERFEVRLQGGRCMEGPPICHAILWMLERPLQGIVEPHRLSCSIGLYPVRACCKPSRLRRCAWQRA